MWKWIILLCAICSASLSAEINVLAFSGSTRKDSVNKKLVLEAAHFARGKGANVTVIDFKDYAMPFYDGDLEAANGMPIKAKQLRQLMIKSRVIFIASPNYNSSLSAVLKNAIDWASRSEEGHESREAFKGKIFVIMSAGPGASGGAKGLGHLKTILEKLGGTVLPQQFVVPHAGQAFDQEGHLISAKHVELQELIATVIQNAQ